MNSRYKEVIKLRKQGWTFPQIKKELTIPLSTISTICRKVGLNVNPKHRPISLEEIANWQLLYDTGLSVQEVAKQVNRARNTVRVRIITRKQNERTESYTEYMSKYIYNYKKRIKNILVKEHGGKCTQCGYDKNVKALQFHHLDPKQKLFGLASTTQSLDKCRKEMKKCILVCANCHIELEDEIFKLNNQNKNELKEDPTTTSCIGEIRKTINSRC